MPLRVFSFCIYFTPEDGGPTWSDVRAKGGHDIFAASAFVKAIKDESFGGYQYVPVPRRGNQRLEYGNRADALDWFAEMVANVYEAAPDEGVHLVPAPGSDCTSRSDVENSMTARLCWSLCRRIPRCDVHPLLWWRQAITSARKGGGSRSALLKYSQLVPPLVPGPLIGPQHEWILVDDNLTTGGTMQAMARRLRERGAVPAYGVCVSRTSHGIEPAFALEERELEDLE